MKDPRWTKTGKDRYKLSLGLVAITVLRAYQDADVWECTCRGVLNVNIELKSKKIESAQREALRKALKGAERVREQIAHADFLIRNSEES